METRDFARQFRTKDGRQVLARVNLNPDGDHVVAISMYVPGWGAIADLSIGPFDEAKAFDALHMMDEAEIANAAADQFDRMIGSNGVPQ